MYMKSTTLYVVYQKKRYKEFGKKFHGRRPIFISGDNLIVLYDAMWDIYLRSTAV